MSRPEDAPPVRVYSYGLPLGPAPECADLVDEQIVLARRYHNDLIAVERARRQAVRAIMGEVADVAAIEERIAALDAELQELRSQAKRTSAAERRRVPVSAEVKARIAELRAELKAARAERREARAALRDNAEVKARIAECNARANEMRKLMRAACGVYWGTYLLVERAIDQAARGKMDPRHRRWDGSGRIGVQLQGGLPVPALFGSDSRIQIDQIPTDAMMGSRAHRRRATRTTVRLRIGSEGRAPIWASFPVILHRPLPEDGVVKWAWAQRRRIGTRWRWELQLIVEARSFTPLPKLRGDACAIDIGWRTRGDEGLRVGYLANESGHVEELLLPRIILDRLRHADSLRAIRDRNFDVIRGELAAWLAENDVPDWLRAATRHLHQWRSTARLASVAYRWREARFEGDEGMFTRLDAWRRQDRHLYQWEASERSKAIGRRRDHYRVMAADLARRYSTIVLERVDLREIARLPQPEEEDQQHAAARWQRRVAAVSELRDAIRKAAAKTGAQVVEMEAAHTTTKCHACGDACSFDAAEHLIHTCEHCGVMWDQDVNAACNLLRMHTGASGPVITKPRDSLAPHESRSEGGVKSAVGPSPQPAE